jgi:hypothetical protein
MVDHSYLEGTHRVVNPAFKSRIEEQDHLFHPEKYETRQPPSRTSLVDESTTRSAAEPYVEHGAHEAHGIIIEPVKDENMHEMAFPREELPYVEQADEHSREDLFEETGTRANSIIEEHHDPSLAQEISAVAAIVGTAGLGATVIYKLMQK